MKSIGLREIENIHFPKSLIKDIYKELQETGNEGYERLALCAGEKVEKTFSITHILYPEQYLQKTLLGVSFHVDGKELERIGDWCYINELSLIAQIHSHPEEAYHSEADDKYSIITKTGGLSIVVPYFGYSDSYFNDSAFYRLYPETGWTALSKEEASTLIKLTE